MSILAVEHLCKSYRGLEAVKDVSFAMAAGERLALIGPNGAGKSTCFNMINGQIAPTRGSIHIFGRSTAGMTPGEIGRLGVGRTFQVAATFASMTVAENVQMALLARRPDFWTTLRWAARAHAGEARRLLALVGMADQAERSCGELAYGDLKRLELAIALANDPNLLLMDEPAAGMAPKERHALMNSDGANCARARDRRLVHRTRHGRRIRSRGPRSRARSRPFDRRGPAGGGARRRAGPGRLPRRRRAAGRAFVSALEVSGLEARYGRARILFDLALDVGAGEVVALLGRNGAGKSTTLRSILGLVPHRAGKIVFGGEDISGLPTHEIVRRGLGYVPEDRRIFTDSHDRGKPSRRPPAATPAARRPGRSIGCSRFFRTCANCAAGSERGCRAASSRC